MRLVRLDLVDYRGFVSLELSFEPDLTVVVGRNGAGKTAILEAVAQSIRSTLDSRGRAGAHIVRIGAARALVTLTIDDDGERHAFEREVLPQGGSLGFDDWLAARAARRSAPPLALLYSVDRAARDLTPDADAPDAVDEPALDVQPVQWGALFRWIRDCEDLENERIRDHRDYRHPGLRAVRKTIEKLVPGITNPRVRRPEDIRAGGPGPLPRLSVSKQGQKLYFDQLSDGERALVALGGDLARRLALANPGSPDPTLGEGVVLIDEVDQHLHPSLQREVLGRLRGAFPNLQWVVTTHSPLVVMHAETRCIRLLRDFALVPHAPTAGRDANSLLVEVFETPKEPDDTARALHEIALLIDRDDLPQARAKLDELARRLGDADANVVRNRSLLDLLEADL